MRACPNWRARSATTRSAAAVELWGERLAGAIVAIGNAPTALFHLLERLDATARRARPPSSPSPSASSAPPNPRQALIDARLGIPFITLRGRRGGSALAAAAVNALLLGARDRMSRWLTIIGIGEDGLDRPDARRPHADRAARRCSSAASAISPWCRTAPPSGCPGPRRCQLTIDEILKRRERPRGRAGDRRSPVVRHRRHACCAPCRAEETLDPAGRLGLRARLRAPRLAAGRGRVPDAPWPLLRLAQRRRRARREAAAAEPRRRHAAGRGAGADARSAMAPAASSCSSIWAAPTSGSWPASPRAGAPARSPLSTRSPSNALPGPGCRRARPRARPARRRLPPRRPAHQARGARGDAWPPWRRCRASCCGTSAPAAARSPSSGCAPPHARAPIADRARRRAAAP